MQPSSRIQSRLSVALGTFVSVDAEAAEPAAAHRGIGAAFAAISTVERLMHPRRPGSDLTLLATCPPGTCLSVHPWTWEVLALCRQFNIWSHGIFDPCLHVAAGRMTDLELIEDGRVRSHAPLRVDLGGIAKGYAVDRAIDALRDAGCDAALVNAGGDLAAFGARSHRIVCRVSHAAASVVELRDAALATSDVAQPSRPREHQGHYHGIDRTLCASGGVTVIAPSAAVADALTKCLLFGDSGLKRELLEQCGARELVHQKASPSPKSNRLKSEFSSNH
jgi:thiamine biosynthesis lipoprotein